MDQYLLPEKFIEAHLSPAILLKWLLSNNKWLDKSETEKLFDTIEKIYYLSSIEKKQEFNQILNDNKSYVQYLTPSFKQSLSLYDNDSAWQVMEWLVLNGDKKLDDITILNIISAITILHPKSSEEEFREFAKYLNRFRKDEFFYDYQKDEVISFTTDENYQYNYQMITGCIGQLLLDVPSITQGLSQNDKKLLLDLLMSETESPDFLNETPPPNNIHEMHETIGREMLETIIGSHYNTASSESECHNHEGVDECKETEPDLKIH